MIPPSSPAGAHEGSRKPDSGHEMSGAAFSECGTFRYRLWRYGAMGGRKLAFVMLNPSTADGQVDDPTIRKCRGFAARRDFDAFVVVNLFAYRATDPKRLNQVGGASAIGPENDAVIREACQEADMVIAAWGATDFRSGFVGRRARAVVSMLTGLGVPLYCLGWAANGQPRHPLMLAYSTPLEGVRSAGRHPTRTGVGR